MKRILTILLGVICGMIGMLIGIYWASQKSTEANFLLLPKNPKTPLTKYSIPKLKKTSIPSGDFKIINQTTENENFTSYIFEFRFNPTLDSKDDLKITTGLINIPKGNGPFPVILMIRGYVDQSIYKTGIGTNRAGEFFAENGYITIAPDYLGYANSDSEAGNIFETRFQTYTTTLSLLQIIKAGALFDKINTSYSGEVNIWAHSNGGQIALTTLTITEDNIPTVLWAPVTKPFPYSILYYTDESADGGKLIRSELSKFENLYNTDEYTFTNYLEMIKAPLQVHQGTEDDAVPVNWSNSFVSILQNLNKNIEYFTYPGADHNLRPSWDEAVRRSLLFYESKR